MKNFGLFYDLKRPYCNLIAYIQGVKQTLLYEKGHVVLLSGAGVSPSDDHFQVHQVSYNCHDFIFLDTWIILYCVNVPHFLYAFICWWISSLFPFSSYYKYSSSEYGQGNVIEINTLITTMQWLILEDIDSFSACARECYLLDEDLLPTVGNY